MADLNKYIRAFVLGIPLFFAFRCCHLGRGFYPLGWAADDNVRRIEME